MNPQVILTICTFTAVFLAVFGVNLFVGDLMTRNKERRLRELEVAAQERATLRAKEFVRLVGILETTEFPAEPENGERQSLLARLRELLFQAQVRISPSSFLVCSIAGGCGAMCFALFLSGSLGLGTATACVVGLAPYFVVTRKRAKRQRMIREQLPEALELMSRSMRAGQSIMQSMQVAGQEIPAPLGLEFVLCYEQQNLGISTASSLRDLSRRTGILEIKIFVAALLIHQQSGGNLARMMDRFSKLIRSRFALQGKITAMTSEGRLQAAILLLLPFAMFFLLLNLNRPYALQLFDHSSLVGYTLVSMGFGTIWIRRIVNFDF